MFPNKISVIRAILFLSLNLVLFSACSSSQVSLSKNQVKLGEFEINAGVYKDQRWNEDLKFKRVSWFQELNMVFDLLVLRFPSTSPYMAWFSSTEKRRVQDCPSFLVTVQYNASPTKISRSMFRSQMEEQGAEEILIPDFSNNLKLHPRMDEQNFQKYRVVGYCQKNGVQNLNISFPGYQSVDISL